MAPSINFTAKEKNGNLVVRVVGCTDLPDLDGIGAGFGNKTDAYVIVRVGSIEVKTKSVKGKINPIFEKESSTFTFDVQGNITGTRINFTVMDKDTITSDDMVGTATVKLTSGQLNGVILSLPLYTGDHSSDSD